MADHDPLAAAVAVLREPVHLGDRAVAGVLAELRREVRLARWRRAGWCAALAAGLLLAIRLWPAGAPAPARHAVRFAVAAPAAGRVALIGDFNDWDQSRHLLHRQAGEWSVTLELKPGRYRYAFVLDDSRWVADPGTPAAEDEFGTPTSAITVTN